MKIKLIPEQQVTLIDEEGKEYTFTVKGLTRKQWLEYEDRVKTLLEEKDEKEVDELLNELLLKYAIEDDKARKMIINGSIAAYRQIITLIRDLSILGEEAKKKSESTQG